MEAVIKKDSSALLNPEANVNSHWAKIKKEAEEDDILRGNEPVEAIVQKVESLFMIQDAMAADFP